MQPDFDAISEWQPLISYINKRVSLTHEELAEFLAAFELKRVRKRQIIMQPGFVARHRNYVLKGAFKAYIVDDKDAERIIQLSIKDWWISDYNSYIFQSPATMFVEALEDSKILQLSYDREQILKQKPVFETFFRIMAERSAAFLQHRVIDSLTKTASERYHQFLAQYPDIADHVPQYILASYLGMTTQFLSRIRKQHTSGQ